MKMRQELQRIWIGLDWGTHSSKWWYSARTSDGALVESNKMEPVIDSTIYRAGGTLQISREGTRQVSNIQDARLKSPKTREEHQATTSRAQRNPTTMLRTLGLRE
jgi:hypothetical protein